MRGGTPYFEKLDALLRYMDEAPREACQEILGSHADVLAVAPGSKHNHQAWPGGYLDHITEVMNIAMYLYDTLDAIRKLPFSRSDALFVLFLHDIEKPWRFGFSPEGAPTENDDVRTRGDKEQFRKGFLGNKGIVLTPEQENAMKYVEGEIDDYSNTRRVMNPLAAFCHLCDVTSARIWFDHPLAEGEKLLGSSRSKRD